MSLGLRAVTHPTILARACFRRDDLWEKPEHPQLAAGFFICGLLAVRGWPVIRQSEVARVGCLEGVVQAARITGT